MAPFLLPLLLAVPDGGAPFAVSADESEDIRILLASGRDPLTLGGAALALQSGDADATALGQEKLSVSCAAGAVVALHQRHGERVTVTAASPIEVLGRKLRGAIELSCAGVRWTAINVLPLETYLEAVLGAEMPPAFPLEALKAQAVAARSYALMRKIDARDQGKAYHLNATVLSQVYAGLSHEDPRTLAAVAATRGEILAQGMSPVEAYFHASCGGETESGEAALGRDLDYLKPVDCPCKTHSPFAHWRVEVTAKELGAAAGLGPITDANVISRTPEGRAARLRLRAAHGEDKTLSAIQLRAALGYQKLPSTWFDLTREGTSFILEGRGSGHGAGLCQWGARALAEQGQGYRNILAHYYPGTEVERIY